MDITMVNLEEILPQATIMVVTVTGSTTSGKPLSEETLAKTLDAATTALQLDEDKALILRLVQTKMHKIAPNLSKAVGTEVAARLMGVAGGLVHLSKIPACNVQVREYHLALGGYRCRKTSAPVKFALRLVMCNIILKSLSGLWAP